jgi:hypothetical protein
VHLESQRTQNTEPQKRALFFIYQIFLHELHTNIIILRASAKLNFNNHTPDGTFLLRNAANHSIPQNQTNQPKKLQKPNHINNAHPKI